MEELTAGLGQRPRGEWVATSFNYSDRQAQKERRRQDLATAQASRGPGLYKGKKDSASGTQLGTQKGSSAAGRGGRVGGQGKATDSMPDQPQLQTLRRHDESLLTSQQKATRHKAKLASVEKALQSKAEQIDGTVEMLAQEEDSGNVEYKLTIRNPHPIRLQQLITQMKFRLSEGSGECWYYVGVEDDGYPKGLAEGELEGSLDTLVGMATSLGATASLVRTFRGAHGRMCALMHIQEGTMDEARYTDLRVAVAGSCNCGKSTLVAVLTHGTGQGEPILDSGRGSARMAVLRYKHELESGRTSSVSQQLLGYDACGNVLNYAGSSGSAQDICAVADKVLTFIDMGGHQRCLKTALWGLTALLPDFALLCCCASTGLGRMGREHLAVALALELPVAVAVTKCDLVDEERLAAVVQEEVRDLVGLAMPHQPQEHLGLGQQTDIQAATPVVGTPEEAVAAARQLNAAVARAAEGSRASLTCLNPKQRQAPFFAPIFPVSAVTGAGLSTLHAFLHALHPVATRQQPTARQKDPCTAADTQGQGIHSPSEPQVTPDAAQAQTSSAAGEPTDSRGPEGPQCSVQQPGGLDPGQHCGPAPAGHSTPMSSARLQAGLCQQAAGIASRPGGLELHSIAPAAGRSEASPGASPDAGCGDDVHFQVDQTFELESVGSVLSGTVIKGVISVGAHLLLGPDSQGRFEEVEVSGIQRARIPVKVARAGQSAALAVRAAGVPVSAACDALSNKGQANSHTLVTVHPVPSTSTTPQPAHPDQASAPALECGHSSSPVQGSSPTKGARSQGAGKCNTQTTTQPAQPQVTPFTQEASPDLLELFDFEGDNEQEEEEGGDVGELGALLAGIMGDGGDLLHSHVQHHAPGNSQASSTPQPPAWTAPLATMISTSAAQAHNNQRQAKSATAGSARQPPAHARAFSEADMARQPASGGYSSSVRPCTDIQPAQGGPAILDHLHSLPPSPSAPLLSCSPPSARKGAVLIGPGQQPCTAWGFEALIVLLGGHWPPRGLVSGCWPPMHDHEEEGQPAEHSRSRQATSRPLDSAVSSTPAEPAAIADHNGSLGEHEQHSRYASGSDQRLRGSSGSSCCEGDSNSCSDAELALATPLPSSSSVSVDTDTAAGRVSQTKGHSPLGSIHYTRHSSPAILVQSPAGSTPPEHQAHVVTQLHDDTTQSGTASDGEQEHAQASAPGTAADRSRSSSRQRSKRAGSGSPYFAVIHCANVRQLAQLVSLQEVREAQEALLPPSMRAAARLLHAAGDVRAPATAGLEPVAWTQDGAATIVVAMFRFVHRPEWVSEGARLIIRDRSLGHVSGAGIVQRIMAAEDG